MSAVSHEEQPNPNPHDDPNARSVLTIGVAGAAIFVAVVIMVAAFTMQVENRAVEDPALHAPPAGVALLNDQQEAALRAPYAWVDQDKKIVHVPIDRAMEIVARELRDGGVGLPPEPAE
ncbi:MAG: hypothetical protein D6744_16215 [Planctomycetota bacterium]|nr:MAG: hypothetical protein D6744_16215 [Planctomycetota bacterium]